MVGWDPLWQTWAIRTGEGGPLKAVVPLHPLGGSARPGFPLPAWPRAWAAGPAGQGYFWPSTAAVRSARGAPKPLQKTGPVRRLTPDLGSPAGWFPRQSGALRADKARDSAAARRGGSVTSAETLAGAPRGPPAPTLALDRAPRHLPPGPSSARPPHFPGPGRSESASRWTEASHH